MTFLPLDHITIEHNYTGTSWQDFTADLISVDLTLRELDGQHSATLTFINDLMDPAENTGTRVIKKGDTVRVHMDNDAATRRKTGSFIVTKVGTAVDFAKPAGRQYVVTVNLRGKGVAGVGGSGASSGTSTLSELSNTITGAPFEINGDGFGSGTTAPTGSFTEESYDETKTELDQILLTRDDNPGTIAYEDPNGAIQIYDSAAYRTGAASHTITPAEYSQIDTSFDMSHIVNVLTIRYLEKIKGTGNKPTRTVKHDHTYTNSASVAKYGKFKKTHVVHKKINFGDYADSVFDRNADPELVPTSVTVPIRKPADLLPGWEDGLYVGDKVTVNAPDGVTSWTCRVRSIRHQIVKDRWLVTVGLRDQNIHVHRRTAAASAVLDVANNPDGTILEPAIDDDAISTRTIAAGAVDTTALANLGVTTGKIANGAVTSTQLSAGVNTAITLAQSTADGKNTITYSTSNPSGTPAVGDTWFKFSGGLIVGQWKGLAGTPNTWSAVTLDSAVIGNLDAGKITTGTLSAITISACTLTSPIIQTDTTGSRMVIQDDPSGGIVTFWLGSPFETPGILNPGFSAGFEPQLGLRAPTDTTNTEAAGILMSSGRNTAGHLPFLALDPGAHGSVVIGVGFNAKPNGDTIVHDIHATGDLAVNGAGDISGNLEVHTNLTVDGSIQCIGAGTTTAAVNANINTGVSNRIRIVTSLKRFKLKRKPITLESARGLLRLTPVTWFDRTEWIENGRKPDGLRRIPGVTAEDVEANAPEYATYGGPDGELNGVSYDRMIAGGLVLLTDHDTRLETLEADNARLRSQVELLTNLLTKDDPE